MASSYKKEEGTGERPWVFKLESYSLFVGLVNHASTCISNNTNYFIGPLKPINDRIVKGCGGVIKVVGEGTAKYSIEDDYVQIHSIIIHNLNYIPEATMFLLFQRQWYQQSDDNHSKPDGTWCTTKSKYCILYWNQ